MEELFLKIAEMQTDAYHQDITSEFYLGMTMAYERVMLQMIEDNPQLRNNPAVAQAHDNILNNYPALSRED